MSFAVEPKGKKTLNPKQIGSSITLSRGSKKMPLRHERKKEEAPIRVGVSRLRLALLFEKIGFTNNVNNFVLLVNLLPKLLS